MITLLTNEWTKIRPGVKPWAFREVLVRYADDTKEVLMWNGMYWLDPHTKIRRMFTPEHEPTHFYIFEKYIDRQNNEQ